MSRSYAYPASIRKGSDGRYLVQFPDLPEALTDGATREEALAEAVDALSEALMARIKAGDALPRASVVKSRQKLIEPEMTIALKAAIYEAIKERKLNKAQLSRKLDLHYKEAQRLINPEHPTKLPRLQEALRALGCQPRIVFDRRAAG